MLLARAKQKRFRSKHETWGGKKDPRQLNNVPKSFHSQDCGTRISKKDALLQKPTLRSLSI